MAGETDALERKDAVEPESWTGETSQIPKEPITFENETLLKDHFQAKERPKPPNGIESIHGFARSHVLHPLQGGTLVSPFFRSTRIRVYKA